MREIAGGLARDAGAGAPEMENARGVQATGVIFLISEIARTGENPRGFISPPSLKTFGFD